ncbi:hypothetical protein [Streptomyces sp. NPDC087787]|uniref:hypothetical protein n=1 Tax=Streptomyces sp. NPDC087787 TaxID=3365803 RepID=UPI003830EA71
MSQLGVALVSAGSALSGATIAGLFTLLKGRQESRERSADREEQRRQRRLDARRTAYMAFLKEFSLTTDACQRMLDTNAPAETETWETIGSGVADSFGRLFQAKLEVEMVGPPVMAAQAERVLEQVTTLIEECEEAYAQYDRYVRERGDADPVPLHELVEYTPRLVNRLNVQRDRFVGAARVQLDGDVNEVPTEVLSGYLGALGAFGNQSDGPQSG